MSYQRSQSVLLLAALSENWFEKYGFQVLVYYINTVSGEDNGSTIIYIFTKRYIIIQGDDYQQRLLLMWIDFNSSMDR